jgi:hypothetical protein
MICISRRITRSLVLALPRTSMRWMVTTGPRTMRTVRSTVRRPVSGWMSGVTSTLA